MKKRSSEKKWIPFWADKWLWGSMRIECTIEERAIWIDLLALGTKDDGFIRANEDIPYPVEQLAGMLRIPKDRLQKGINKFVRIKKLTRLQNKTLYITEWKKYQLTDRHKRRVMSEKKDTVAAKEDPILDKNREEENRKEDKNILCEKEFQLLWKAWPKEGRFDSKETLKKLKAIHKQGKLDLFKKVTNGYLQFLHHKEANENFPQKAKHLKTWMNNWEGEREQYENFKYEQRL